WSLHVVQCKGGTSDLKPATVVKSIAKSVGGFGTTKGLAEYLVRPWALQRCLTCVETIDGKAATARAHAAQVLDKLRKSVSSPSSPAIHTGIKLDASSVRFQFVSLADNMLTRPKPDSRVDIILRSRLCAHLGPTLWSRFVHYLSLTVAPTPS